MTRASVPPLCIIVAEAEGPVLALPEGLSFWGGVDPATGTVIDAHHPSCGESLAGKILMMPTSRGSCSGSGVLLELALNGHAPAALIFRDAEDILTLGALICTRMFGRPLAVLRLGPEDYGALSKAATARITETRLEADGLSLPLSAPPADRLDLTDADRRMLDGSEGKAVQLAMQVIRAMAVVQGADGLTDVTRAHIDGCIYASPAYLRFAEVMTEMGARVRVPTTMNAISVDHSNWREQGVAPGFGLPASRLADLYVGMGAEPSFTCAPYLLNAAPQKGEAVAWAESNAVIYANSVLGARTVKHADFMDLCIALTGRAARSGVYVGENRTARRVILVDLPEGYDDALWPMLGYLAGRLSPDRIPLICGLEDSAPSSDDLKALCAAFGTTSAAPMLHVSGITPEAATCRAPGADVVRATCDDLAQVWNQLNSGPESVDLVAFGSPHFSLSECRRLAALLDGVERPPAIKAIVTLSRDTLTAARKEGTLSRLTAAGIDVVSDLCWCSISEPVFPPETRVLMTNSGKYAHYAPGLSGREVRFGSLRDCVAALQSGRASATLPEWLN